MLFDWVIIMLILPFEFLLVMKAWELRMYVFCEMDTRVDREGYAAEMYIR